MSTSDYREPTNEELWPQPPVAAPGSQPAVPGQSLVPHQQVPAPAPVPVPPPAPDRTTFVLALVSIVMAIPLTAIATGNVGLPGLYAVWIGIVLVNAVYAWGRRR